MKGVKINMGKKLVCVEGYDRDDGTYVEPHRRRAPRVSEEESEPTERPIPLRGWWA